MEEKPTNKPTFTAEQLKQLLSLQNDLIHSKKTKGGVLSQKIVVGISKTIQNTLYYLDRFVNFVTKNNDVDRNDVVQTARAPILFGVAIIICFVLVGGIWGSFAPLDSAAGASGVVVTYSNKQIINHQEGGIIANIFVKQGDKVKAGDKLIKLEDTKIKSQYEITLSQYRHALAAESRLMAERDNQDKIEFPELLTEAINLPEVARVIHTQESLFYSKKEMYKSEKNALYQRIEQLNKKIEGMQARKTANVKSLEVIRDRLKAIHTLHDKGFSNKAALLEVEAKEANFKSEIAMTESDIAATKHTIIECEISIINLQNKYTKDTLTELKDAQGQVSHLKEQFTAYKDSLSRTVITSPVDGIVNVLHFHTIGGVIPNNTTPIVEISPTNDTLIIEAKVPQKNIDSVHEGLLAKIRFSAFKSRTTPLFTGKVVRISPDTVQDRTQAQQTPETFYVAIIEIDMEEFNKIAKARKLELHPGMQVEVQIVTGTRTLLRYLLDPITDTMFRAFKEK
ncbi:HlyD family type I secretion periplasmic adaptor subunit [Rickettsia endosymbiont of Oedothorax gibbosus]|uniref:HlyD family type I secretion periplasmic adaptor subunit n=1 Tax=Rickettsia endosymbiont of Oedothorax gibbosus TaxID=931099 RepID=UPI0020254CAD|nr:HlyD family type I secretion periplasmic adaptor subunit [Rickettsia endosymbiont of Oedothorax gibbosus]